LPLEIPHEDVLYFCPVCGDVLHGVIHVAMRRC